METKIKTWGHTNDFNNKVWYINKWLNWNLSTLNLRPTDPKSWKKAIHFPHEQPHFAKKFIRNIKLKNLSLKEKTDNFIYDIKVLPRYFAKKIKRKIINKYT